MQVTTIIVNWQRPQDTIECINSVKASQIANHRILVIDNGSEDNSIQIIGNAFPDIELVALPQNLGFSGGFNAGIQHALEQHEAAYLFLLNNDTIIKPNAITQLLASNWDVAIPKIFYYADPQRIWAAGAKWRWLPPSVKMIGHQKLDHARYRVGRKLDYATGCALLISHQVAKSISGFDPLFENYMEDYDFFFRVKAPPARK